MKATLKIEGIPMENKQGFTIENGILKKYNGPGGDAVIPEGIAEIGGHAFEGCTGLTIHVPAGSYAERYAKKFRIKFEAAKE